MTLKSPVSVHVEKREASFGDIMNRVRAWLDRHKIEPAEFRSRATGPGEIALDLRFKNENEARLFEREFA